MIKLLKKSSRNRRMKKIFFSSSKGKRRRKARRQTRRPKIRRNGKDTWSERERKTGHQRDQQRPRQTALGLLKEHPLLRIRQ
jgi:hypothetical protein